MPYKRLGFFFLGALALTAEARRRSRFLPGTGCGTTNTIKIINGNPTNEEETSGCIYIKDENPFKFRGNIYVKLLKPGPRRTIEIVVPESHNIPIEVCIILPEGHRRPQMCPSGSNISLGLRAGCKNNNLI